MAKGLGKAIKTAREAKKLSQMQVATRLGVSVGIISRYERGEDKPRLERLVDQIAPLLELDAEALKRRYYKMPRTAEASS
jgi:transcriptional regulator with XRE-family HTH domain